MNSNLAMVGGLAVSILVLHAMQVNMLATSLGAFWRRTDQKARLSKLLLLLSLISCGLAVISVTVAIFVAMSLFAAHAVLSMNELR